MYNLRPNSPPFHVYNKIWQHCTIFLIFLEMLMISAHYVTHMRFCDGLSIIDSGWYSQSRRHHWTDTTEVWTIGGNCRGEYAMIILSVRVCTYSNSNITLVYVCNTWNVYIYTCLIECAVCMCRFVCVCGGRRGGGGSCRCSCIIGAL